MLTGYHRTLLYNIDNVLKSSSSEEITSFESRLRENIHRSNNLRNRSVLFTITFLLTHFFFASGAIEEANVFAFKLKNSDVLRLALLWLCSAGFVSMLLCDFMWRCHKETCDYLLVLQGSPFTSTGLHDFSLPPSNFQALDLFKNQGSKLSKVVGNALGLLINFSFISAPVLYIAKSLRSEISELPVDFTWLSVLILCSHALFFTASVLIIFSSAQLSNPNAVSSISKVK